MEIYGPKGFWQAVAEADPLAIQRERFAIRESLRAPIGTDADPVSLLRAGIDPAAVAEAFGLDNPLSLLGKDQD